MPDERLSFMARKRLDNEGDRVKDNRMLITGIRRLCRVGLAAVLVTALCVLTLVDLPPQLPEPPFDPPPTPGKSCLLQIANVIKPRHQIQNMLITSNLWIKIV